VFNLHRTFSITVIAFYYTPYYAPAIMRTRAMAAHELLQQEINNQQAREVIDLTSEDDENVDLTGSGAEVEPADDTEVEAANGAVQGFLTDPDHALSQQHVNAETVVAQSQAQPHPVTDTLGAPVKSNVKAQ
jgi:hypothetical protein